MKVSNILGGIKEGIIEQAEELGRVVNMPVEEYAEFYGSSYTKFVKTIRTRIFKEMAYHEANDATIQIRISKHDGDTIIFDDEDFGKKETFNYHILKRILLKLKYEYSINEDDNLLVINSKNQYIEYIQATNDYTEKVKEAYNNVKENAGEYTEKIKDAYNVGKEKASKSIKKGLNIASDWANKNL